MKKKKTIRIYALCIIGVLAMLTGWYWYESRISNPWSATTLGEIPTPLGYTRITCEKGSYGDFLRSLPLKKKGTKVYYFTKDESGMQFLSTGVIDIPILSNDEQCADVTMHLRAEYLWQHGRYGEIMFHDVNGNLMRYHGGSSRKAFEKFMRKVYCVSSTFSVFRETTQRDVLDIQPGDLFCYPAHGNHKLGHAILIVDVAKNIDGKVAVMCVEGNTPARDMHLVCNINPLRNPWFLLDKDASRHFINVFQFEKQYVRHY